MTDPLNALAADAARAIAGGEPYTYAAVGALDARILVVEEGGQAFPSGRDIGAPEDDGTGKWTGVLEGAGFEAGTYSWWNAVPCGLARPLTADDKARGRSYLKRAIALHRDLYVIIAVGTVAKEVVTASRTGLTVFTSRSPMRTSPADRERIRETFVQARLNAYPLGVHRD